MTEIVISCPDWSAVGEGIPQLRFVYPRPTFTATILVPVVQNKSTSLLRELLKLHFHENSSRNFIVLTPQQGHLVTWLETKNCATALPAPLEPLGLICNAMENTNFSLNGIGIECTEQIFKKIKSTANKRQRRRRTVP